MTGPLRLLWAPNEVTEALVAGASWSAEFEFCTPAVDSRLGRWPIWHALFSDGARVRRAFVGADGLRSEPHALEQLHRLGVLRFIPAADGSFRPHLFRFRQGRRVRVLAGAGALVPDGIMAPLDAATFWEGGDDEAFALQVERMFSRAQQLGHVPDPDELRSYSTLYFDGAAHRDALAAIGAPLIRRTAFDGEVGELVAVEDTKSVGDAMKTARRQLTDTATQTSRQTLGFHGGSVEATVNWSSPLGIWSFYEKDTDRHYNYFGASRPDSAKSLQITVQVNVPLQGIDRKTGGAVARDVATGKTFLVHRGRIGGGQKGVGADLFWSRFRGGVRMRESHRDDASRVVIVGEVGADSFPRDVASFVHEVARIKRGA